MSIIAQMSPFFNVGSTPTPVIEGWDVSTGSFVRSQSITTTAGTPNGVAFSADGLTMVVIDNGGDVFAQYTLGTAWDIASASFSQNKSVSPASFINGAFWTTDGTKAYVVEAGTIHYWQFTTEWDVSTGTRINGTNFTQDTSFTGGFIRADGLRMYLVGSSNDNVYEYILPTAFNPAGATFSTSFSVSGQEGTPRSVFFRPTGRQMYIVGYANDTVYEYHMDTAWDIANASYANRSLAVGDNFPGSMWWRADGQKLYIPDASNDSIYEYDIDP